MVDSGWMPLLVFLSLLLTITNEDLKISLKRTLLLLRLPESVVKADSLGELLVEGDAVFLSSSTQDRGEPHSSLAVQSETPNTENIEVPTTTPEQLRV
jgi:hypothetical protein